jgi:hypothetical protein
MAHQVSHKIVIVSKAAFHFVQNIFYAEMSTVQHGPAANDVVRSTAHSPWLAGLASSVAIQLCSHVKLFAVHPVVTAP